MDKLLSNWCRISSIKGMNHMGIRQVCQVVPSWSFASNFSWHVSLAVSKAWRCIMRWVGELGSACSMFLHCKAFLCSFLFWLKIQLKESIHSICKGGKLLVMPPTLLFLGLDGICLDTPTNQPPGRCHCDHQRSQGHPTHMQCGPCPLRHIAPSKSGRTWAWPCLPALCALVCLCSRFLLTNSFGVINPGKTQLEYWFSEV